MLKWISYVLWDVSIVWRKNALFRWKTHFQYWILNDIDITFVVMKPTKDGHISCHETVGVNVYWCCIGQTPDAYVKLWEPTAREASSESPRSTERFVRERRVEKLQSAARTSSGKGKAQSTHAPLRFVAMEPWPFRVTEPPHFNGERFQVEDPKNVG